MTTTTPQRTLSVRKLNGNLAAEITDVDLDELLASDELMAQLRDALWAHKVLVFPGLDPDFEQHKALARIFGEIEYPEAYITTVDGHPEICNFDSMKGYTADTWHADVMWRPVIPLGAVLRMHQLPESGGDTIWADTAAAYDALSDNMKRYLDGATAYNNISAEMSADHPVVVTHPETGRRSLFVSETWTRHINDVPPAESGVVMRYLLELIKQPEFSYRHRWGLGDVVIWDNRTTQHYAVGDYDSQRIVHRVGIKGAAPTA